jgi:hypothetical protein
MNTPTAAAAAPAPTVCNVIIAPYEAPADLVEFLPKSHTNWMTVTPVWAGVDRSTVGGWQVTSRSIAERLSRAILAGVVFPDAHVATDVNGRTYAGGHSRVSAKYANADLKRLGF